MGNSSDILELAAQYHASGNVALAEQYAASILDEEPNHPGALHLLGLIAKQKGDLRAAIVYLNRSLTANGSNAAAWQHAGDILMSGGDVPGGITYYEQVLRLRPDFADGWSTLGLALQRVGQAARAVECLQRAVLLAPSSAPAHNNLGSALRRLGKRDEAAAAFEAAQRLWPDSPDIAYNLGNTRFDQGDLDAAIACYRRALNLKPTYAAEVSNSLATALKVQGHWQEAVAQYQETLRLRPGHAMALYNLSEMAAAGCHTFSPEELAHLKEDLAAGRGDDAERSLYAFAAANMLHLQGAFDEALRYYREGNDLQVRILKKRNVAFNAHAFQANIDRIIAEQGPAYVEMIKDWGIRTALPVFVIGLPCSGGTRVAEILAGHPKAQWRERSCERAAFPGPVRRGKSDRREFHAALARSACHAIGGDEAFAASDPTRPRRGPGDRQQPRQRPGPGHDRDSISRRPHCSLSA